MTTALPPSSSAPPITEVGPLAWIRKNLFGNWFSSVLTVLITLLLLQLLIGFITWSTTTAQWMVIPANLPLYFTGRFPADQYWRLWVMLGLILSLSGLSWGVAVRNAVTLFTRPVLIALGGLAVLAVLTPTPIPYRILLLAMLGLLVAATWAGKQVGTARPTVGNWLSLAWFVVFLLSLWLISGGLGLKPVSTSLWGGLMLSILMAVVSIALCFPLGVLLALGRQSDLPVVRILSVLYIELVRGVPLISILFIGQVMIPLFLPQGIRPDNVIRAIAGLTLFSAAYLAENVRGGLQAIPRGQTEAAKAVGLNPALTTALVVLPQALKISIPAIVGQFISLFQDTTLLSIVSMIELLGISRAILANPEFIGRNWEVYLFIGVIYWVVCYAMSWGSRQLEYKLRTTH